MRPLPLCLAGLLIAVSACGTASKLAVVPPNASLAELWSQPNAQGNEAFYGPWGVDNAPDCTDVYEFEEVKRAGTNPGIVVKDSAGREWQVKQPPMNDFGDEGPVEVTVSRILTAAGYHQPPVYYLSSFLLKDMGRTRCEPGGRFRLKDARFKDLGPWSFENNPFLETKPFKGLLVILMMLNSTDLKPSNNSVYEEREPGRPVERRFVVRDIGMSLGGTGKIAPRRGNIEIFEREPFITGVTDGLVEFNFRGPHADYVQHRVTPADVRWAANLLARLTAQQWKDAFRAGGFDPGIADRFIRRLREKIAEGQALGSPSLLQLSAPGAPRRR